MIVRRDFIKLAGASPLLSCLPRSNKSLPVSKNKSFDHSICRWCYQDTPLEQLVEEATSLGIGSIELLDPQEWDVVLSRGLQCAVSNGSPLGITKGFNTLSLHAQLKKDFEEVIPAAADRGIPNVICFSGNKGDLTDEHGIENCAVGLEPIVKLAEKYNINVIMELLNSKVDHPDYQCDTTQWGVALVDKIGSPNFKLLYDIYHMQIMEGDIIATITEYKDYIAHFHTGGVPGRNEIDETQELNYSAIIKAINDNGFNGYVAQEFIPTWEKPFEALEKAINICTV